MQKNNLTLSRFFSTGPAIVVAFDHGMFDGPIPGLIKMDEIPDKILPDIDAVLMSPGTLRDLGPRLCGHRNSPIPIVRINWCTVYCFNWDYHSGDIVPAFTPEYALQQGAQLVLISLSLKTGNQQRDARNVEIFANLCSRAHQLGLPVMAEYFPIDDEKISPDELYSEVKIGARILYELGADVIKTFYTKNFEDVVAGCPTPICALGGKRTGSDLDALKLAQQQIKAGAAGIVFGRFVLQADKPLELQKALIEVVKHNAIPEDVAKKFRLS